MKYYRVPKKADQAYIWSTGTTLIAEELFTEAECKKHNINAAKLEQIEISKNKTYFAFGCRFEMGTR